MSRRPHFFARTRESYTRGGRAGSAMSRLAVCVDCRAGRRDGDQIDEAQRVAPGDPARCMRHAVEHAGASMRERLRPILERGA